ncbi:hypothetical protein J6590_013957 [Homalodisca vitripennis]|nr:hypothetical protein J6590_013957 [Homalodisca vitripennis]
MVDVCVGTSVGTITDPDCLGPCEPGTSVTLEGIVWHETEGVLVVNVTWRGKTYVGTLLDCTRHDWAPPRFCDSPTSDLDARTPKGRGKRGRQATTNTTTSNDLSNFTETRSSVHSKLRSNNNGGAKGRRNPGGPASPTPFVPPKPDTTPGKRKPKAPEEEAPAKKSKPPVVAPAPPPPPVTTVPTTQTQTSSSSSSSSPPPSPVLLECPEPNCSKKYKHINGLKYHQSHAHGNADDEETKESAGSLSEAEEEPSPAPVVKKEGEPSPAEVTAPETPTPTLMEVPLPSPQQPPSTPTPTPTPEVEAPPQPSTPDKSVIKPGVLRFGTQEEALLTIPTVPPSTRPVQTTTSLQPSSPRQPSPAPNPQTPIQLVIQPQTQPVTPHVVQIAQSLAQQNPAINAKVPQFKVKPTSVLMPDDKKIVKPPNHKKKSRKSPAGSPHPHPHLLEPQPLGLEPGGREDVQSPAYSDISDDGAPVLDPEVDGSKSKPTTGDKKVDVNPGQSPHSIQHYNMYPYYGQPPYLVPSVTTDNKPKDNTNDKSLEAKPGLEKEKKEGNNVGGEFQQKMLPQHYYPYGYVPSYPYNLEPGYSVPMVAGEEKTPVIKEEKSPGPNENIKQNIPPVSTTLHVPNPNKIKTEPGTKEKHPNENHQILKESIEMKNQMSPAYLYSRPQQQQTQGVQQQDEMRRYYIYPERRKDHSGQSENNPGLKATPPPQPKQSAPAPSPKHKDKPTVEDKKEEKVKQEGVKPTMETQGPPPPPTSSYAYIHPGYMQSPHYGAIPFDPSHSMYARGINPMIVPSPYPNNPYIHPQLHPPMPRYHAPEDLSRPPPGGPKALDLLQHHANQYYTSHKIHELQERALKSPTPKATVASASPSAERQNVGAITGPQGTPTSTNSSQPPAATGKSGAGDSKEARSPPPQRHVHTHHHTHVGLGYPILTGQYPAPYGAAVLASQQAAAVASSVISPYSPK